MYTTHFVSLVCGKDREWVNTVYYRMKWVENLRICHLLTGHIGRRSLYLRGGVVILNFLK